MKKIILIFTLILLTFVPSHAIEEDTNPQNIDENPIELKNILQEAKIEQVQNAPIVQDIEIQKEETFKEKVHKILEAEIERTDVPTFLLKDQLTHKCTKGPLESIHLWGSILPQVGVSMGHNQPTVVDYSEGHLNVGLDGVFKGGKEDFRLMFNFHPHHNRTFWQHLPADIYVATNRIPHHRVMFGNFRPMVGVEGGQSPFTLSFVNRSQIARTYGTVRKFGVRVSGDYDLVDYEFGGYSSDTYFKKFFPGVEFIGWVNVKPLAKTDGRYGKLKIGGGIDGGQYGSGEFFVAGAYAGYEYKKFFANFEWAQADGSNGATSFTNKKSTGFYATVGYNITKKLQILARYDQFDPNRDVAHNLRREYTAGINYFIKGQALKLIFNYIFCQNQGANDSHRIMVGTQILL